MRTIRAAHMRDVPAVAAIYEGTHTGEEQGLTTIGWVRGVYPTEETARRACEAGELYVMEQDGVIAASARFNQAQETCYQKADWLLDAPPERVLVMHTLVVAPKYKGQGCGKAFIAWYEETARAMGCTSLRMDTNERNLAARALYKRLGYREAGIVPCTFNGIGGVNLVCLEKVL